MQPPSRRSPSHRHRRSCGHFWECAMSTDGTFQTLPVSLRRSMDCCKRVTLQYSRHLTTNGKSHSTRSNLHLPAHRCSPLYELIRLIRWTPTHLVTKLGAPFSKNMKTAYAIWWDSVHALWHHQRKATVSKPLGMYSKTKSRFLFQLKPYNMKYVIQADQGFKKLADLLDVQCPRWFHPIVNYALHLLRCIVEYCQSQWLNLKFSPLYKWIACRNVLNVLREFLMVQQ